MSEREPSQDTAANSRLLNLLGLILVDGKPRTEQITLLTRAGLASSEIGRLLGISPITVRTTLSLDEKGGRCCQRIYVTIFLIDSASLSHLLLDAHRQSHKPTGQ